MSRMIICYLDMDHQSAKCAPKPLRIYHEISWMHITKSLNDLFEKQYLYDVYVMHYLIYCTILYLKNKWNILVFAKNFTNIFSISITANIYPIWYRHEHTVRRLEPNQIGPTLSVDPWLSSNSTLPCYPSLGLTPCLNPTKLHMSLFVSLYSLAQ